MRLVIAAFKDHFAGHPQNDRISHHAVGAYCLGNPLDYLLIVAPTAGSISCYINDMPKPVQVQTPDILNAHMNSKQIVQNQDTLTLNAHKNFTAFIIKAA